MKIQFDRASSNITYPVDLSTIKRVIRDYVPAIVSERVAKIRIGCNRSTTQEARIVGRGTTYEIRINFCLINGRSRQLSEKLEWVRLVESFGGVLDKAAAEVEWPGASARRYAIFLLLHEIGHAVYAADRGVEYLQDLPFSRVQEEWCDRYARDTLRQIEDRS